MKLNQVIIVDDSDTPIGCKDRSLLTKEDIYRVSALWITNSKGEILLTRRHHTKINHPGKWGPAVAGTVEEGETYEENIVKEAEEELGLKNIKPSIGPKIETKSQYHHFTQWFILKIDRGINEFTIQKDEIEEVKWISPSDLKQKLQNNPEDFLPTMGKYLNLFSL